MSDILGIDPCGPPPLYDGQEERLSQDKEKCRIIETDEDVNALATNCSHLHDDPPPYLLSVMEKKQNKNQMSGFGYIQPSVLRSWNRFLCSCSRCSISVDNLVHNLWYFQINYISVLLLIIIAAIFIIDNCDFNLCILMTILVMFVLYLVHTCGCYLKLLGRRLSLLEELITVFMLAVPSYGLIIPGSAPVTFMFFLAGFAALTLVHACVTPVQRSWFEIHKVHDV